jgi:hypothetical protein
MSSLRSQVVDSQESATSVRDENNSSSIEITWIEYLAVQVVLARFMRKHAHFVHSIGRSDLIVITHVMTLVYCRPI